VPSESFVERLRRPGVLLLDGATGTELERRGFALERPGWSARAIVDAPETLVGIHADYAAAGAEIVTANTFRLHRRNLAAWGAERDAESLVRRAVDLARSAGPKVFVAGSLAPIGDCYSPGEVPPQSVVRKEHQLLANDLASAGVDLVLVETMIAVREAAAAAEAASRTGLPFMVSFVTGADGRLLSGERLSEAVDAIREFEPSLLALNCLSVPHVEVGLSALRDNWPGPMGVYANTGIRDPDGSWRITNASDPAVYAVAAQGWRKFGASLIGGCCGTTPAHVAALKAAVS
jgi:S-methylmethionine-dependent homocysteine/selenocysteine methylase